MDMDINHVRNIDELDAVLQLIHGIFPQLDNDEHRYSRNFWVEKMRELPELLLYARDGSAICGSVSAWEENRGLTMGHCGADSAYRGEGIGSALMVEAEERAKNPGYHSITLGAIEGSEGVCSKLGYKGSLLMQSQEHSIDDLNLAILSHQRRSGKQCELDRPGLQ